MITIIAGSRGITDYKLVDQAVAACGWKITKVVSGEAPGVDLLGEEWAAANYVPVKRMAADWKRLGKAAGHIRNNDMSDVAKALIAIWDGKSPGTKNMIETARRKGLRVYVHNLKAASRKGLF